MATTNPGKRSGPPAVKVSDSFDCCKGKTCDLHRDSTVSVLGHKPIGTWTSLTNMPKEIAELAIDAPVRTDTKVRISLAQINAMLKEALLSSLS